MKNIAEIRKEYRISNAWLAKVFGYKNVSSYNKSAGKKSIENGVVELVNIIDSDNAEKNPTASGSSVVGCGGKYLK